MPTALSQGQMDALRLAVYGDTAAEIGRKLLISEVAAQERLKAAQRSLGARNRHNATALAVARGLVLPEEVIEQARMKRAA